MELVRPLVLLLVLTFTRVRSACPADRRTYYLSGARRACHEIGWRCGLQYDLSNPQSCCNEYLSYLTAQRCSTSVTVTESTAINFLGTGNNRCPTSSGHYYLNGAARACHEVSWSCNKQIDPSKPQSCCNGYLRNLTILRCPGFALQPREGPQANPAGEGYSSEGIAIWSVLFGFIFCCVIVFILAFVYRGVRNGRGRQMRNRLEGDRTVEAAGEARLLQLPQKAPANDSNRADQARSQVRDPSFCSDVVVHTKRSQSLVFLNSSTSGVPSQGTRSMSLGGLCSTSGISNSAETTLNGLGGHNEGASVVPAVAQPSTEEQARGSEEDPEGVVIDSNVPTGSGSSSETLSGSSSTVSLQGSGIFLPNPHDDGDRNRNPNNSEAVARPSLRRDPIGYNAVSRSRPSLHTSNE